MSDTQTNESNGILGELHAFEKKIEHALGLDGSPSSTEPTSGNDAGGVSSGQQSPVETSVQDVQGSNAGAEGNGTPGQALSAAPSTGDQSGSAATGEPGNDQPPSQSEQSSGSSAQQPSAQDLPTAPDGGEQGNASENSGVSNVGADVAASTITDAGDAPNAAAPTAGDNSASDTQSSAPAVSVLDDALETVASVSEQVGARIYKLRQHFWTFEANARAPFIKLLDEIEELVK